MVLAATGFVSYLPIASTVVAAVFSYVLWQHWRRKPQARHVMWWMIGIMLFGLGTLTEALTTLFGWHEPIFRSWYIAGALLGGAPLAQGTVYLMLDRRKADKLATWLMSYIAVAATFALVTPLALDLVEPSRLSAEVIEWRWVRLFSPVVNTYALYFLVGGAILSAIRYRRQSGSSARMWGNISIAVGGILPGIGGAFTRMGHVEVLFVTELVGLSFIWLGYHLIVRDGSPSVHAVQQESIAIA